MERSEKILIGIRNLGQQGQTAWVRKGRRFSHMLPEKPLELQCKYRFIPLKCCFFFIILTKMMHFWEWGDDNFVYCSHRVLVIGDRRKN